MFDEEFDELLEFRSSDRFDAVLDERSRRSRTRSRRVSSSETRPTTRPKSRFMLSKAVPIDMASTGAGRLAPKNAAAVNAITG